MYMDNMLQLIERLRALEIREEELRTTSKSHSVLINEIEDKLSSLINEMKQIRNALYVMAFTIACNVPAVSNILEQLKLVLK